MAKRLIAELAYNKPEKLLEAYKNPGYSRLLGEFIGTIEGVLAWQEVPQELKIKLQQTLDKLNKL